MPDQARNPEVRGSRGYAEQADALVARYEAIDFPTRHEPVLPVLPPAPGSAIDIGAGSGADAAWLAEHSWRVVAVEPTEAMRSRAIALAEEHGLRRVLDVHAESRQAENRDAGVSWTQLAFRRD